VERLKLIVQNRRFLVLSDKGASPNLASQTMGAALRALSGQWQESFGYRPLLAESFTDPEAFAGTCYKASNWQAVGMSAGYSRHRADFYVANERPKKLWLYPLDPQAREHLRAVELPPACERGRIAPPSGVIPVSQLQMLSLLELLRKAPDPRGKNTRLRIGPVLAIIAMALLAGRRDISAKLSAGSCACPAKKGPRPSGRCPATVSFTRCSRVWIPSPSPRCSTAGSKHRPARSRRLWPSTGR
jgi:hypothetical protein